MNIILTDEQFAQLKPQIEDNITKQIANIVKQYIEKEVNKFNPTQYKIGEIRNTIKNTLANELKERILNKIDIPRIGRQIEKNVNQRVQVSISTITKTPIEVKLSALLSLEN